MNEVSSEIPHATLKGQDRNLQIQWLRAIAAIMVMLFHASVYGSTLQKDDSFLKILDGKLGISGVSLFFAISGYLMATAVRVQAPVTFLAHRLVRIYPTFFIAAALYCGVEYLLHQPLRVNFIGLTLAPVGSKAKYPLRVEWTLVFEVTFYVALFAVAALGQARRLPWIGLGWIVVLIGFSLYKPDIGDLMYPIQRILTVSENVGMAGGLLIPSLLRLKLPPTLLIVVGMLAWPIFMIYAEALGNDGARWLFGIGATLVVAGTVGLSARWPNLGRNRAGLALAGFGDDSYALYLIHGPIIYSLYSSLHGLPFPVLWLLSIVVSLTAAVALGRLDVGLYRRLKSSLKLVRPLYLKLAIAAYLILYLSVSVPAGWKLHVLEANADRAQGLAALIGATRPIATVEDARQAALAAGFTESSALRGALERAAMKKDNDEQNYELDGWVADTRVKKGFMPVALFQNGHLLTAGTTNYTRRDIGMQLGTKAKTGFAFTLPGACVPSGPVIGLALTPDHMFAVLQGAPVPDCSDVP